MQSHGKLLSWKDDTKELKKMKPLIRRKPTHNPKQCPLHPEPWNPRQVSKPRQPDPSAAEGTSLGKAQSEMTFPSRVGSRKVQIWDGWVGVAIFCSCSSIPSRSINMNLCKNAKGSTIRDVVVVVIVLPQHCEVRTHKPQTRISKQAAAMSRPQALNC